MAMQFKTMTQMTQMTQWPPAGPACMVMLAPACGTRAPAQWPPPVRHAPAWPLAFDQAGRVGPTAKGRQKRTGHEQFFFSYKNFFFL